MIRILSVLILLAALAACAGDRLPQASGPVVPMNVGQWTPTAADLQPLPKPREQ
jgi:hypothetical protein